MDTAQLPNDVKQTFKNNQPSILSTIGNAIKKAFGYLIDVAFGWPIVQDANAGKLRFFRSLRNRHLSVNLSDASKVQGSDHMLIGNSKYLQYFCNTTNAMADMPRTDIVVVNTKKGINQLSNDGSDQYTDASYEDVQFSKKDKANDFKLPETCKLAHWNLLSIGQYTQTSTPYTDYSIAEFILNFFDSIEEIFKNSTNKELTLAVQMPIFKSEDLQKSNELTEIFLDYFELARMKFAKKLGKKITIKLYRSPKIADKDLHDKNLTDISKLLNKKRNNPSSENVQEINRRLKMVTDHLGAKTLLTTDTASISALAQTKDSIVPSYNDDYLDSVSDDDPVSVSDNKSQLEDTNNFSALDKLHIPTLSENKFTHMTDENGKTVMRFGVRFYQNNNTSLQEQLSSASSDNKKIDVKTFNPSYAKDKSIEATNDFTYSIAKDVASSSFGDILLYEHDKLLKRKHENHRIKDNLITLAGKTELEVTLPSINDMEGETLQDRYDTFINFVSKLNSRIQDRLTEEILANYNIFKKDESDDLELCVSKIGIIYTLDNDTLQHIRMAKFPLIKNLSDTDILNFLVSAVSARTL